MVIVACGQWDLSSKGEIIQHDMDSSLSESRAAIHLSSRPAKCWLIMISTNFQILRAPRHLSKVLSYNFASQKSRPYNEHLDMSHNYLHLNLYFFSFSG